MDDLIELYIGEDVEGSEDTLKNYIFNNAVNGFIYESLNIWVEDSIDYKESVNDALKTLKKESKKNKTKKYKKFLSASKSFYDLIIKDNLELEQKTFYTLAYLKDLSLKNKKLK